LATAITGMSHLWQNWNRGMVMVDLRADPSHQMSSIVVLAAHPNLEHSRVNRQLIDALRDAGSTDLRDLYALYPDYLIDVPAEQASLARAQLVVWLHPIHWYSMPPLMKLWVDEVLAFGWAYGPGGSALKGKDLWLVATTGGPQDSYHPSSYNNHYFDDFLPPYRQTAALTGMRFLDPLVLHGAHRAADDEVAAHIQGLLDRVATYPGWVPSTGPQAAVAEVPAAARPA
jgi:glutathione-regulated potassium-efflux system ancillary protein KefF